MFVALLCLQNVAAAAPVLEIDPWINDFGYQVFGSETVGTTTLTNVSRETLLLSFDTISMPDDFAELISSTCDVSSGTTLLVGESCTIDVRFRPDVFFAGFEYAAFGITATDVALNVLSERRAYFAGVGVLADATDWDRTIDFSEPGQGDFDPKTFDTEGAWFTSGDFVGYVQGDEALVGPVEFKVYGPPTRAVVTFAPSIQGAAWYDLTALGVGDRVLASTRVLVIQDDGAGSASGPFGYETIELDGIPAGTRSLALTNEFESSSYAHVEHIDFAVAQIELFHD